jgi:hypothetical protein
MSSIGSVGPSGYNPLQQAMQQLFSKSDANTDGKLDTGEISSMLDALQEVSSTSSSDSGLTADKVVSAFDSDGDGAVSGSEFDAGFKKLGEQMQGTMIAMQEGGGQMPPPPPPAGMAGPPAGMSSASEDDEDDDSSTSTVSDLMELLESYSSQTEETASTDEDSTTDTLLQTFLSQLEKYAKNQDYQSTYLAQYAKASTSGVSLSA